MEITINGGDWLGVDWAAIAALATVGATIAAAVAAKFAWGSLGQLREQQRLLERQHREGLRAAARPAISILWVDTDSPEAGWYLNVKNIGVGPLISGRIEMWSVHYEENVDPDPGPLRLMREDLAQRIQAGEGPRFSTNLPSLGVGEEREVLLPYANGPFVSYDHPGWIEWRAMLVDVSGQETDPQLGSQTVNFG